MLSLLHRRPWLAAVVLAVLPGAAPAAEGPALRAAAALYDNVRTETLPNGLRVYLCPVQGAPAVTTMVAYKVGSADEDLSHTGLAHYLEHLMFKGTEKLFPGDIDRLTMRRGGANNAYTGQDYTIFHFDFAADRWEAALEIEADRMRNLRIDDRHEFEGEKKVVVSELKDNEDNQPWDLEQKALLPLLFGTGPYGHPVIGEREHVFAATAPVIKGYYDRWYHPNNASLVVCGGFDPDRALARIKELFGPIPRADLPPRRTATPVKRTGPVRKEIASRFDLPRLLLAYNTVRQGDPDGYALEVAQAVLSGGKTGRLYKKLVEEERIATAAAASSNPGRYPGYFAVQVDLLPDKDRGRAEKLVFAELQRLCDEPVSDAELRRVQRGLLAGTIFGRESVHELADTIARGVTTNDLDYLKSYLPRLQAVTARDVQAVARKYFKPEQRVLVWSVPGKGGAGGGGGAGTTPSPRRLQRLAEGGGVRPFSLKDVQRVTLPNGLKLLLFEDRRLPIVVAEAHVNHVRRLEPADKSGVAALVGMLLDEGTPAHTGPQIAELIENTGGELSFSASGGSLKVLTPDRSLGLSLLFECLAQASFPKDAFERDRTRQLSTIEDTERQPDTRARQLFRATVYGAHPLGRPALGRRETVRALTADDCRAFHRRVFVPNNTTVALVGDFDSKEIVAEVTRLTADWKSVPLPLSPEPAVELPKAFTQKIATMAGVSQLYFYMGHVGIRRTDPDYYKLLVMDYVLGTGPGFTDRLSARLRDREGLGYTVSAQITGSADEEPGLFTCYIDTQPEHFGRVKKEFLEEIARLHTERPKAEEVEDAKQYLIGNLPLHFTTRERIAGQLLAIERLGLGFNYLDDYRKAVAAVTPEDVRAVAAKHLHPERMVLVAAGAVDAEGKPLEKVSAPGKGP
jgi:zinc protease